MAMVLFFVWFVVTIKVYKVAHVEESLRIHLWMVCMCISYRILQIVQGRKVSRYVKLDFNLLENICGWTIVLYGQSLLYRLFHWKVLRLLIDP